MKENIIECVLPCPGFVLVPCSTESSQCCYCTAVCTWLSTAIHCHVFLALLLVSPWLCYSSDQSGATGYSLQRELTRRLFLFHFLGSLIFLGGLRDFYPLQKRLLSVRQKLHRSPYREPPHTLQNRWTYTHLASSPFVLGARLNVTVETPRAASGYRTRSQASDGQLGSLDKRDLGMERG